MNSLSRYILSLGVSILVILLCVLGGCREADSTVIIRGDKELVLVAEYVGWACGGDVPQIIPLDDQPGISGPREIEFGFVFFVPQGLPAPDQVWEVCLPGNRFKIRGYPYFKVADQERVMVPRFDLVSWDLLLPAERVDETGTGIQELISSDGYHFISECGACPQTAFTIAGRYRECE